MANDMQIAYATANAACDAIAALCNSGKLRIYTASKPANADTALSGQTLLAELTLNATAFGAASNGVATANAITSDSSADNTGTAAWFRVLASNGTTVIYDGTVGTSGCDLNLNTTSITSGAQVAITALTITVPRGA